MATVVGMIAEGMTFEEILADFSQLTREDVQDALRYAAAAVDEREPTSVNRTFWALRTRT